MSGMDPLPANKPARAGADATKNQRASEIASRARSDAEEARERLATLVTGGLKFEVTDDGRHMEGFRADAPPELVRKLRRGVLPVDVTLDLHGQRAADAEESLLRFSRRCARNESASRGSFMAKGNTHPATSGSCVVRSARGSPKVARAASFSRSRPHPTSSVVKARRWWRSLADGSSANRRTGVVHAFERPHFCR